MVHTFLPVYSTTLLLFICIQYASIASGFVIPIPTIHNNLLPTTTTSRQTFTMTSNQQTDTNTNLKIFIPHQKVVPSCHSIRRSVFVEEQGVPEEVEYDTKDNTATHILATLDDEPVGAARIVVVSDEDNEEEERVGKIGRVCVLKEQRGMGIGRAVVQFAIETMRRRDDEEDGGGLGCGVARLGAQVYAIPFYEGMGFVLIPGEEYMDAGGVPHRDMELEL